MSLWIYNTLSGKKELFKPIEPGIVRFYVCGVTVYDYSHLGHARANVVFDCIRRYLTYCGYHVIFVQNFTDIDDKIIARASQNGHSISELTSFFIQAFKEDMGQLFIDPPTHAPCATDYVSQMIAMIQVLLDKGIAYRLGGDVCFSIEKFPEYGKLSHKVLEELVSGARVQANLSKHNPLDFVLWKSSKPGEPFFDSPFGPGRPGWHIECSAMATSLLGDSIDIHGGGEDLIFPHHENEIAQSEACTGKPFVNYWIHNGFVTIQDEKMSKSQGNFFTLREVLSTYSGAVIRFFLMKAHYRTGLNFSYEGLDEAKQAYERFLNCLRTVSIEEISVSDQDAFRVLEVRFFEALDQDFNTAEAIGVLFDLVKQIYVSQAGTSLLKKLGGILGLFLDFKLEESFSKEICDLAEARVLAKKEKRFSDADALRERLKQVYFIAVEDIPGGYRLKRIL